MEWKFLAEAIVIIAFGIGVAACEVWLSASSEKLLAGPGRAGHRRAIEYRKVYA